MHKRSRSRFIQIRIGGVRRSSRTTDPEAAKALEAKLNLEQWKQEHIGMKPPKSWMELCLQWEKEKKHKASWGDDLRAIAWWGERFEKIADIRKIDRDLVDKIIQERRPVQPNVACPANNSANHYVSYLRAMLIAANREWGWTESSPKLRTYPITEGRERWLTVPEWHQLAAPDVKPPLHLLRPATFGLATGMRENKVFELEWTQISMRDRRLTFKGTANKLGNTIPLNHTAMRVLEEIAASPVKHMTRVFCWEKPRKVDGKLTYSLEPLQSYGKAWWKWLERAKFGAYDEKEHWQGDVCWHTLRHTFASWLGNAGVPEGIIDRLGGWSGGKKKTRERYTHLAVDHLRPYADVIDRVLAGEQVAFRVAVSTLSAQTA